VFIAFRPERSWAQRLRAAATYAGWCAPGCVAVAIIQQYFYGSPFASGYGSFESLFTVDHVLPNLRRYFSWLTSTFTPVLLLALAAPALLPGALTTLLLALFVVNLALYLPYLVFDDWSYLRFLLPTLPLLLVLLAATLNAVIVRAFGTSLAAARSERPDLRQSMLAVATLIIVALFVHQARTRHAFDLRRYESRFERAGEFVAARLPANALVITDYESGSIRFYSGRPALAWGALDPAWLDRAVAFARDRGLEPFLLFERAEEPEFRTRFAASPLGALDWPPAAEIASQVRVYRVADRERYRQGLPLSTEYAR
jgi:hypothetical protein